MCRAGRFQAVCGIVRSEFCVLDLPRVSMFSLLLGSKARASGTAHRAWQGPNCGHSTH